MCVSLVMGVRPSSSRLQAAYPQHASLVMRGIAGQQEEPLKFQTQANGHDLFTVALAVGQPFDYALRVTTPCESCWLTPKGEEHDRLPHNWFRYERRAPPVDAPDVAARRQVASMLCYEPQLRPAFATPAWVRDAVFYQIFPDRFARGESTHALLNVQPWAVRRPTAISWAATCRGFSTGWTTLSILASRRYISPRYSKAPATTDTISWTILRWIRIWATWNCCGAW